MICIGLTDLSMRTVAFEYDLIEKCGKFVFHSADYHSSPSVICDIRDGDVVGFLYDSETATAGFTINGIPQRRACLQDVPSKNTSIINPPCCFIDFTQIPDGLLLCTLRPYVPHLEGPCRSRFNYGQSSFQYSIANHSVSTNKITNYLDSLVNAPYK